MKKIRIDSEKLIAAVKSRPTLYDKSDPFYCNRVRKTDLWTEVCKEVFDRWDDLKPQYKNEYGWLIHKRWKCLRNYLTRELALQRKEKRLHIRTGKPIKRRKRYEYYKEMSFLFDHLTPKEYNTAEESDGNSSDPLEVVKNEPNDHYEVSSGSVGTAPFENETTVKQNEPFANARIIVHQNEKASTSNIDRKVEFEGIESYAAPINYDRTEALENKIFDMLKEIKKGEEDGDRQFMLSLVSSFKKLNDKQKFEARIEILKVLQNVTFKQSSDAK